MLKLFETSSNRDNFKGIIHITSGMYKYWVPVNKYMYVHFLLMKLILEFEYYWEVKLFFVIVMRTKIY